MIRGDRGMAFLPKAVVISVFITTLIHGCAAQCEVPDHFTKVGTETDNQAPSITFATPFPIGVDTGGNAVLASQANVDFTRGTVDLMYGDSTEDTVSLVLFEPARGDPITGDFYVLPEVDDEVLVYAAGIISTVYTSQVDKNLMTGSTVTWCNSAVGEEFVSFQLVLVTNGDNTFALYNYLSSNTSTMFGVASAAIGLTDEALIGDDPTTYQPYAVLSCTSNTGCPSQWLFQIEAKTDIDGICGCGNYGTLADNVCTCPDGLIWNNKTECIDVDECATGDVVCPDGSKCFNLFGGVACSCLSGFVSDGVQCRDIDECIEGNECPETSDCVNLDGSYECQCHRGYREDGLTCQDVDECSLGTHKCGLTANCTNTPGSYRCSCRQGLLMEDRACFDIDECTDPDFSGCGPLKVCVNTYGSFECRCRTGFTEVGGLCQDFDECSGPNLCSAFANCTNTYGAYTCRCFEGYQGNGFNCKDVDECIDGFKIPIMDMDLGVGLPMGNEVGLFKCDVNAECTNVDGSYSCVCKAGFSGWGGSCKDLDECEAGSHDCPEETTTCVNVPGSYKCQCREGFSPVGNTCRDFDECQDVSEKCGPLSHCVNTVGSFKCVCNDGYEGNGHTCRDVNECSLSGLCHPNAKCTNLFGSYRCDCLQGYTGNGFRCQDVDECITQGWCSSDGSDCEQTPSCSPHAECFNMPGSYSCDCMKGFRGNGFNCTDNDECKLETHNCPDLAECKNTVGSFKCECVDGYHGNGLTCRDDDECLDPVSPCHDLATCDNTAGSYRCSCCDGFTGDGHNCQDVDECVLGLDDCADETNCTNTLGSFDCGCPRGFQGDGVNCTDIDECVTISQLCSANAVCENTEGNFTCTCKDGYSGDGLVCNLIDDDNCPADDPCSGNGRCVNSGQSFSCVCYPGWVGDDCSIDEDDCPVRPRPCYFGGRCVDGNGTFSCVCRPRFTGPRCLTFINPCTRGFCHPGGRCSVGPPLSCVCRRGWTGPRCNIRTGVIRIWRSLQHVFLRVTSDFADLPEELEPEERIELFREIMDQVHQSMIRRDIIVYDWDLLRVRPGSIVFEVEVVLLYLATRIDPPSLQLLNEVLDVDYVIGARPEFLLIANETFFLGAVGGGPSFCVNQSAVICPGSQCFPYLDGYYCACPPGLQDDDQTISGRNCVPVTTTTPPQPTQPPTPTQPTQPTQPPRPTQPLVTRNTGLIVGVVVGGLVLLAAVTLTLLLCSRRRRMRLKGAGAREGAYTAEMAPVYASAGQGMLWSARVAQPAVITAPTLPTVVPSSQILAFKYPGKFLWRSKDDPFQTNLQAPSISSPVVVEEASPEPQPFRGAFYQAQRGSFKVHQRQGGAGGVGAGQQAGLMVRPGGLFWRSVVNDASI